LYIEPYLEHSYASGNPEPGVQEEIVKRLDPACCFYDVGAHIGYYSLIASRLIGKAGRIVAFEPDPANLEVLKKNLSRNGVTRVEVVSVALWSHCGVVAFRRSAAEELAASSRRGAVAGEGGIDSDAGLIRLEALTVDAYATKGVQPTMIKIDVEGAEVEVLKGAQGTLSRERPVVLVEVHHQRAAAELPQQLCPLGYKIEWLPGHPGFAFPRHLIALPR